MSTLTAPAWATSILKPENGDFGMYSATIAVRNGAHQVIGSLELNQVIELDGNLGALFCDPDDWTDCTAQDCRDLAATLLKAAQIIDAAT